MVKIVKVYFILKEKIFEGRYSIKYKFDGTWIEAEDGNIYLAQTLTKFKTLYEAERYLKKLRKRKGYEA